MCISFVIWETIHLKVSERVKAKEFLEAHNFKVFSLAGDTGTVTNMLAVANTMMTG